jgi:hypothetical protein
VADGRAGLVVVEHGPHAPQHRHPDRRLMGGCRCGRRGVRKFAPWRCDRRRSSFGVWRRPGTVPGRLVDRLGWDKIEGGAVAVRVVASFARRGHAQATAHRRAAARRSAAPESNSRGRP